MTTTLLFSLLLTLTGAADDSFELNHVDDTPKELQRASAKYLGHEEHQEYLKRNDPQEKKEICWEETSHQKLDTIMYICNSLEEAKATCVEKENCRGIYWNSRSRSSPYYLSTSDRGVKSYEPRDKIFTMKKCKRTCYAGKQRCEDGECRERCSEEDSECPAGTTMCPDRVCRHIHMCEHYNKI